MDAVVQKVIVRVADPDVDFAARQFRPERLPIGFEHLPQIVFLPVREYRFVDLARRAVPERFR